MQKSRSSRSREKLNPSDSQQEYGWTLLRKTEQTTDQDSKRQKRVVEIHGDLPACNSKTPRGSRSEVSHAQNNRCKLAAKHNRQNLRKQVQTYAKSDQANKSKIKTTVAESKQISTYLTRLKLLPMKSTGTKVGMGGSHSAHRILEFHEADSYRSRVQAAEGQTRTQRPNSCSIAQVDFFAMPFILKTSRLPTCSTKGQSLNTET